MCFRVGDLVKIKSMCMISSEYFDGCIYGRFYKYGLDDEGLSNFSQVVTPGGLVIYTKSSDITMLESEIDLYIMDEFQRYYNSPYYPYLIFKDGEYIRNESVKTLSINRRIVLQ